MTPTTAALAAGAVVAIYTFSFIWALREGLAEGEGYFDAIGDALMLAFWVPLVAPLLIPSWLWQKTPRGRANLERRREAFAEERRLEAEEEQRLIEEAKRQAEEWSQHAAERAAGRRERESRRHERERSVRASSRYSEREIVYVLERLTAEGRFFKIGKTSRNDVSRRAYEVRSTIVSYTNSVRERDVHRELRGSRIHRSQLPAEITDAHGPTEWFRPTPEVERFAFEGILPSGRQATMVADRAA
jgi:hypothetical protein